MVRLSFGTSSASGPSGVFGRIVATMFFFGFFAIGSVLTWQFARSAWAGIQTYRWERVSCRIVESGVATTTGDQNPFVFQVRYRYSFRGRDYEGSTFRPSYEGGRHVADAERLVDRYPAGAQARCWVNPEAPHRCFLERSSPWRFLFVLFPLVFVVIGAGGSWVIWAAQRSDRPPPAGVRPLSRSATSTRKAAGCLAGFFSIFFLAGAGFSLFFVVPGIKSVAAGRWSAVPCRVLSSAVRTHSDDDGATYSVDVLYEYDVGGRTYRSNRYQFLGGSSSGYDSKARAVARLPAGTETTCWVNPSDPHDAVLKRSIGPEYFFLLLPLVFVGVGAGGMYFALRQARKFQAELGPGFAPAEHESAPVRSGPVALKSMGPVGKFLVMTLVALFWNAIVAVFVSQAVKAWRGGDRPFGLMCFLAPFVAVGLLLVGAAISSFLATFNPRVKVTLSSVAIPLGGTARVEWRFSGRAARVTRVAITVEGREEASYRSGDSTHTDRSVFARIAVHDATGSTAVASGTATLSIPRDSMHSFAAPNNRIVWQLKLRGEIPSWPDVTQEYDLDVRPMEGEAAG